MVDKKVINYIKKNLLNNYSLKSIKKHLLVHGHKEDEVNKAIKIVNKDFEEDNV